MSDLAPDRAVASFDSATGLLAALGAALRGQPFPRLGQSRVRGGGVRAAGHLPWPVLRRLYARMGAAEGIEPGQLGAVDMAAVARWLTERLPERRYPAALIGSSNGALAHLAAACQVPWLPGTVLVPVRRPGDPERLDQALEFGAEHAPPFLDRNPDVVLHQMHDQAQDRLMVAEMAYFRVKWRALPEAYTDHLTRTLAPGATVVLVEDESEWPAVTVAERHYFQPGAQGGLMPDDYLVRPHTPQPDTRVAEAEWGADPHFGAAVQAWCTANGHPCVRLRYAGPQAPAHSVASVFRGWYQERGERANRLLVPSFALGDPWRTINTASVPYWTFFAVRPALKALDDHLQHSAPYDNVSIMLFQHGADSPGIAGPRDWAEVVRRHGAEVDFPGLRTDRSPHDVGFLGRYTSAFDHFGPAKQPWSPLDVGQALAGLAAAGLPVEWAGL
ncbi:MAG: hypothetical protein ACTH2Q_02200 [Propionibacteriaceae bacterium]